MMASSTGAARLDELFSGADIALPAIRVRGVTTHSGRVVKGGLFLACRGYKRHGLEYLDKALAAGPAAVAWEPGDEFGEPELPADVVGIRVDGLADQVGDIADRFFSRPSEQVQVTGITGTNGKTTTAWLASKAMGILGRTSAYMGTLGYGIGDELTESLLTTPACVTVHQRLRELADRGAECVVMEVSSHGLDQGRVDGVRIQTAAFTNLSRDHLDYHGDLESYAQVKEALFKKSGLKNAVINIGDDHGAMLADRLDPAVNLISVAMQDMGSQDAAKASTAHLRGSISATDPAGLRMTLEGEFGEAELHSPIWGAFNAENLLVASGILVAQGFELRDAAAALGQCSVPPGRMQVISAEGRPTAIVDFAHTPDALTKALQSARSHGRGQLWLVFGCGGNRDQGKRTEMGSAATLLADHVVLTNDNPRHENPEQIINDIRAGMTNVENVLVEMDRRSAIHLALRKAAAGDVVLIAGKGSESYQIIGDDKIPCSDIMIAADYLRGLAP